MAATDYSDAWREWESLFARRNNNPVDAATEFLRAQGWIVERPETLSLPVNVARSGSFTSADGYKIMLHCRVNIGGRLAQVDHQLDMRHAYLPTQAVTGAVSRQFERLIMDELKPQIEVGFKREIDLAKERTEA